MLTQVDAILINRINSCWMNKEQKNRATALNLIIRGGVLEDVLASRTHFEVFGLGLEASSPRKLASPRLKDNTIF